VLVGVGWWRGPLWRGEGGGGGVLFFGAEFAWVKAGRVGGGHVWGVGGMRWGVMVEWINGSFIVDGRSVAQGMMSDSRSTIPLKTFEMV